MQEVQRSKSSETAEPEGNERKGCVADRATLDVFLELAFRTLYFPEYYLLNLVQIGAESTAQDPVLRRNATWFRPLRFAV